jgi:Ras-related protein Rab-7A
VKSHKSFFFFSNISFLKWKRVGKTSLMNRYSTGKFTGQYKATIGADFFSKPIIVTDVFGTSHAVTLQIWDTAGQERFQSLGVGFYRGADGAILVYDITESSTFDHLQHWKDEFLQHVGGNSMLVNPMMMNPQHNSMMGSTPPFPFIVLGNKIDKEHDRRVPRQIAEEWCNNGGSTVAARYGGATSSAALKHMETSSKTAINVDEAFMELARLALQYEDYKRRSQPQLFIPPSTLPIDLRRDDSNDDSNDRFRKNDNCC